MLLRPSIPRLSRYPPVPVISAVSPRSTLPATQCFRASVHSILLPPSSPPPSLVRHVRAPTTRRRATQPSTSPPLPCQRGGRRHPELAIQLLRRVCVWHDAPAEDCVLAPTPASRSCAPARVVPGGRSVPQERRCVSPRYGPGPMGCRSDSQILICPVPCTWPWSNADRAPRTARAEGPLQSTHAIGRGGSWLRELPGARFCSAS
ncbi:hypothetical protein C8Q79DRAFT_251909 [Trametes meyenii]|nr:hypothetical protein C8Q79DRAFT_251909 [Trametes meyenii]